MELNHYIKSADSKEQKNITWKQSKIKNLEGLCFIPNKRIKKKKKTEKVIFFSQKSWLFDNTWSFS